MTDHFYGLFRELCGLSIREAADFHSVSSDSIKSWSSGRRQAPEGVLNELRELHRKQRTAADLALRSSGRTEALVLGEISSDGQAQALGWPCVSAYLKVLATVAAEHEGQVTLAPDGSLIAAPTSS